MLYPLSLYTRVRSFPSIVHYLAHSLVSDEQTNIFDEYSPLSDYNLRGRIGFNLTFTDNLHQIIHTISTITSTLYLRVCH
jgi:hypothetical protein